MSMNAKRLRHLRGAQYSVEESLTLLYEALPDAIKVLTGDKPKKLDEILWRDALRAAESIVFQVLHFSGMEEINNRNNVTCKHCKKNVRPLLAGWTRGYCDNCRLSPVPVGTCKHPRLYHEGPSEQTEKAA